MKHDEEKDMSAAMAEIQAEITQGQRTITVVDVGRTSARLTDILGRVEVVLTDCELPINAFDANINP